MAKALALQLFGQFLYFEFRGFALAFPQRLENFDAPRQSGARLFERLDLRVLRGRGRLECFDAGLEAQFFAG